MYRLIPDTHEPRLSLRATHQKLTRGGQRVVPHLELARLDINRHNPAAIAFFHLRPHLLLV